MPSRVILIVEDDPFVRPVLTRALQRDNAIVLESNGTRIPDFKVIGHIDALVCDIGLPAGNGYRIASECSDVNPDCAVVLISGHPIQELHRRGVPRDAEVLEKPFDIAELRSTVERAMEHRASRARSD